MADVLLLTPEAAAERLAISRTAIYGLMSRGEVPSLKIGRIRRVSVAALEAYVARLSGTAAQPTTAA